MPILTFTTGWYYNHVVICTLHMAMALGRILSRWIEANVASQAACVQVAASVGIPYWSTNLKADDSRKLLRNFAHAVPHLVPGAAPAATVRTIQDMAWAVDRISVGLCHSSNRAELLAHDIAVLSMPTYARNFRIALGISRSTHYVHYLESEVPLMIAVLATMGQVRAFPSPTHPPSQVAGGFLPRLGCFSGDMAETINCRLKDTYLRYSTRSGGKHPGRETTTVQVLQREASRIILEGLSLKAGARPKIHHM